ncbi:hypothetical protein [Devosia sp.]|uniref:hypothetical protein n=1 Tax=Devosia sp. TaxID=1871048 RepID=UPI003266C841
MTSRIGATLHQPIDAVMAWDWNEICDRYADAMEIETDRARFEARLAGAKMKV